MKEINLILVCGQGSIGKSTYIKNIINNFNSFSTNIISMDNISKDLSWENRMKKFIQFTQQAIDKNYDFIFCDLAFDSARSRKNVLSSLKIPNDILINLIILELRPGVDLLLSWDKKRKHGLDIGLNQDEIIKIYSAFNFATVSEFNYFKYNKLSIYILNNYLNEFLTIDKCEYKNLFLKNI